MAFSQFTAPLRPEVVALCNAHGGLDRWNSVRSIRVRLDAGGLAFASRLQPWALRGLDATVFPHEPCVHFAGFGGRPGWVGEWRPGQARWLDATGTLRAERNDPWASYRRWSRQLRWDRLDVLHFAGYALWNYLSFPFLLALPGVEVSAGPPGAPLQARFPQDFPTHSREQAFHLDADLQLLRHDYTAMAFGRWAHAANFCDASVQVGGLRFYTRRRVLPTFRQSVLAWPVLVWLRVAALQLHWAPGAASLPGPAGPHGPPRRP